MEINGYNTVISLEAPGAHKKMNAQICLHNSLNFKIRRRDVDYVSVVASGQPLSGPTLVCCVYLNPSGDAATTTRARAIESME
jgi:hypothetical protein